MKNLDMLRLLNEIDDDLIEKADPQKLSYNRKRHSLFALIISVCLLCVLVACLVIFIPKLNNGDGTDITNPPSQTVNPPQNPPPVISSSSATGIKESYEAIKAIIDKYQNSLVNPINNESAGFDKIEREGDEYLYTLEDGHLYVSLRSDALNYIGAYELGQGQYSYNELLVLNNGEVLVAFYEEMGEKNNTGYAVALDVRDAHNIKELSRMSYTGGYVSARYENGELILLTYFNVADTTFLDGYIPTVNNTLLPVNSIVAPEQLQSARYIVATKLGGENISYSGSLAFLDFSSSIYMSSDSLYISRTYPTEIEDRNVTIRAERTEIVRAQLTASAISFKNVATVEGTVAEGGIDQLNGVLRIFTSSTTYTELTAAGTDGVGDDELVAIDAYLYCIDISDMSILASCECFNKDNEEITLVELDGTEAYVYINGKVSDPVYVFDLSDLENIACIDTRNN